MTTAFVAPASPTTISRAATADCYRDAVQSPSATAEEPRQRRRPPPSTGFNALPADKELMLRSTHTTPRQDMKKREADYTVRPCKALKELASFVDLQQTVWGYAERELYPL